VHSASEPPTSVTGVGGSAPATCHSPAVWNTCAALRSRPPAMGLCVRQAGGLEDTPRAPALRHWPRVTLASKDESCSHGARQAENISAGFLRARAPALTDTAFSQVGRFATVPLAACRHAARGEKSKAAAEGSRRGACGVIGGGLCSAGGGTGCVQVTPHNRSHRFPRSLVVVQRGAAEGPHSTSATATPGGQWTGRRMGRHWERGRVPEQLEPLSPFTLCTSLTPPPLSQILALHAQLSDASPDDGTWLMRAELDMFFYGIDMSTSSPTVSPTTSPTTTSPTTLSPTSLSPTHAPTTVSPTHSPTTVSPTESPSASPTASPSTNSPSGMPTASPTTVSPTVSPSTSPTTVSPTTVSPTASPTTSPSSVSPTASPTGSPTTGSPTTQAPTLDVNECVTGTHQCHAHATCSNQPAPYSCACNDSTGWIGDGFACTPYVLPLGWHVFSTATFFALDVSALADAPFDAVFRAQFTRSVCYLTQARGHLTQARVDLTQACVNLTQVAAVAAGAATPVNVTAGDVTIHAIAAGSVRGSARSRRLVSVQEELKALPRGSKGN
jgi:hypothetical protein